MSKCLNSGAAVLVQCSQYIAILLRSLQYAITFYHLHVLLYFKLIKMRACVYSGQKMTYVGSSCDEPLVEVEHL